MTTSDRVEDFLEGTKRNRRTFVTPEGVPFELAVAGHSERLVAFFIDLAVMLGIVVVLSLAANLVLFGGSGGEVLKTLMLFVAFLVRICYFPHFELTSQGRTPGKRRCGLRVINRAGGELSPGAVIARNLMREVEFFLPLSLLFTLDADAGAWRQITLLCWALVVPSLPLWGRDHLRAGDIIGGTQVVAIPPKALLRDLALEEAPVGKARYAFTHDQLAVYGAFELQVLEELLRRRDGKETADLLADVCRRIRNKIGWKEEVPPEEARRFLTEFYSAERGELERGKLFGRLREDKNAAPPPGKA